MALLGLMALAALAIATPLLTLTPAQMARSIAWEQRVGAMLLGAEAARVSRERADAAYLEVVPPGAPATAPAGRTRRPSGWPPGAKSCAIGSTWYCTDWPSFACGICSRPCSSSPPWWMAS